MIMTMRGLTGCANDEPNSPKFSLLMSSVPREIISANGSSAPHDWEVTQITMTNVTYIDSIIMLIRCGYFLTENRLLLTLYTKEYTESMIHDDVS